MCRTRMSGGIGIRRVRCCWMRCRGRSTGFAAGRGSLCLAIRDRSGDSVGNIERFHPKALAGAPLPANLQLRLWYRIPESDNRLSLFLQRPPKLSLIRKWQTLSLLSSGQRSFQQAPMATSEHKSPRKSQAKSVCGQKCMCIIWK